MARPSFKPTDHERRQVEQMAGLGINIDHIASLIRDGIDGETVRKHFKKELVAGKAKANFNVGKMLFQKCQDGDTTSLIWWSKTQMGWRETREVEVVERKSEPVIIIDAASDEDSAN